MSTREDIALTDEQKCDLERRIADHDANPGNVISWHEALTELREVKIGSAPRKETPISRSNP